MLSWVRFYVFMCFNGLICIFVCFCVSLGHFDFVSFVLLGLVFSVRSQEIGWAERLRNDLFCVEWDVKPCSFLLSPSTHASRYSRLRRLSLHRVIIGE